MDPLNRQQRIKRGRELASGALFFLSGVLAGAIGRFASRPAANGSGFLVVQLGDIGDLVLTSAFLRELGRDAKNSDRKLVLVVKPAVYPLAERCPYADRVLSFDAMRTRYAGALSGLLKAHRFARSELGEGSSVAWNARFDLDELGATFLQLFSGASERVAYSEHVSAGKATRNRGYDKLLTRPVAPLAGASRHEADRLLALLEAEDIPVLRRNLELWLEPEDESAASKILLAAGERCPVALGIGAGHPKRCWPADRFARIAESLYREHGAVAVLLGGPAERPAAAEIVASSAVPVIDTVGHAPLRVAAALIQQCSLYVGNDSGLLHVASASDLPVIEISCHPDGGDPEHPNAPERFGPYGASSVVLRPHLPASLDCATGCEWPSAHCIEQVSVGEVLDGLADILGEVERLSPGL